MANSNQPIWKDYEHRMIHDFIRFDPTPEPTDDAFEFGEQGDLQDRHASIPDPNDHPDPLPMPLTDRSTHAISAAFIEHVALLPEYPQTHNAGCPTEKKRYICSSIKRCEFLDLELARMGHLYADEALFTKIAQARRRIEHTEDFGLLQRASTALYYAIQGKFTTERACKAQTESCRPTFGTYDKQQYVRETYHTTHGTYIFCAFYAQMVFLASLDAIEVDMSYKRVKGVMNEVIFATMLLDYGKIMTLFRVFTDQENPTAYKFIFQRVFELVSQAIQRPIKFFSIHGEGIKAIEISSKTKTPTDVLETGS
ncbi:uncharacterized protein N7498_008993 [Penicillium cinerascens]|uniref:Uncharacterized protein n=1 Tax=Penicillium cinerascens TaxID=70096 RepID=A0A9W9JII3_9EURO|nr:uncharacterized protein N7498_008993 [Penicillium cinerascens]KAJ5195555.1 hypothetical protein N7498_008993 [Penicillium cinerascens]